MANMTPRSHHYVSPAAERRRRQARRKMFVRRRAGLLAVLLLLLTGAYFGVDWLLSRWLGGAPPAPGAASVPTASLSFKPESFLAAGDLNGDGVAEQVALGPAAGGKRQVALVTGKAPNYKQVGDAVSVTASPLTVQDLPRASHVLVLSGKLPARGEPAYVAIPGGQALEAAGGEPYFEAWQLDPAKGVTPANYYALAAPLTPPAPTALVVDKWLNVLWYYEKQQLAGTYRVATGKFLDGPAPSAANQERNYITPLGTYKITNKIIDPPYWKDGIRGGDPKNPLGPRFLGFSVYAGDKANVWGIHGTNEPDSLGKWASTGCIRMKNEELVALFDRLGPETVLEIRSSQH